MKSKVFTYLSRAGLTPAEIMKVIDFGFMQAPASKGHHLAYAGGLARHSLNVTDRLVEYTHHFRVPWSHERSPYIVGMLHDLVKCKCYARDEKGYIVYRQPVWPGHGIASAMMASFELGIRLERDEAAAIVHHMGAFGLAGKAMDEFDAALSKFAPQIIAAHSADWYAARVDEAGDWSTERTGGSK